MAVVARVFYGAKHFAVNFSLALSVLIPASFAATAAGSMVSNTGSYVTSFLMLIGFALLSLILGAGIKKP